MSEETIERMTRYKRAVIAFPHTSGIMDFLIALVYHRHYEFLKDVKIMANANFVDVAKCISPNNMLIPAPYPGSQKIGTVTHIINELKKLDSFLYSVSPKGSTRSSEGWRKSYYIIAKELNCPIIPGGLDFEKKEFVAKEPFFVGDMTFDEVTRRCQSEMDDIIPMFPDRSEFPLGHYERPFRATTLKPWNFFIILVIIIITIALALIIIYLIYKSVRGELLYFPDGKSASMFAQDVYWNQ